MGTGVDQAHLGQKSSPQVTPKVPSEIKNDAKSEAKHEAANKSTFSFRRAARYVWRKIESLPKYIWPNSDEAKP